MTKKRIWLTGALCLLACLCAQAQDQSVDNEKKYDIVVARDGSGDFRNIQDAIESIRAFKPGKRTTVFIKEGVYKEKVVVHTWVTNVDFIGESREKTIITYDDHANILMPGSTMKMGTFRSYTVLVQGNGITFQNMTIENASGRKGQAVALHTEGDRIAVFNCNILGNQDTIYTGREQCRLYFGNCYIDGTTDFIFGPSTAWFEACHIHCKINSYITAASTPEYVKYGYIFNRCEITADPVAEKVYLGRPWRQYGMTLFMHCNLGGFIRPEGWHNWGQKINEECARYYEFENTGEGAATDKRVAWSKQLSKKQAKEYTLENVCGDWNPLDFKL